MKCNHCQQEYNPRFLQKTNINGKTLHFCCNGCRLAYNLLASNNLQSFYEKLGETKLDTPNIHKEIEGDKNTFSSDSFLKKYVKIKDSIGEINFFVNGVTCAACVWLNEQILSNIKGVISAKINYTSFRAKVIFDTSKLDVKSIVAHIRSIGYNPVFYDERGKYKIPKDNHVKMVVSIFCLMNVMWINVGQYTGLFFGIDTEHKNILNMASFLLTTPVLFYCASSFYKNAYFGIRNNAIGMDSLVITGSSIVYLYSIYEWLVAGGETYFESVCMIITFVLIAKFLEMLSCKISRENLDKLDSFLPIEARLRSLEIISPDDIKVGDELIVLQGEVLACDGVLISPTASLDYSAISGESTPILKKSGDNVMAGCIALDQSVVYKATASFSNSSASLLAKSLRDSEFSAPKIATVAFKLSATFSKTVLSISALSFLFHYLSGSTLEHSILIAVSVIIVACPCALALATPIASVVGLNVGFKNHILFTKSSFLEDMAKTDTVVFDKTGTLTKGELQVTECKEFFKIDPGIVKSIMLSSNHHISKSIARYIEGADCKKQVKRDLEVRTIPGRGVEATYDGVRFTGGSDQYLEDLGMSHLTKDFDKSDPRVIFNLLVLQGNKWALAYRFYMEDTIKDKAKKLIETLHNLGKQCILLSGDHNSSTKRVAEALGFKDAYSDKTPLEKAEFIRSLINDGKKVVMVGDGLNDSLALNYANVGISMGSGSDISILHSDVVILDNSLDSICKSFELAKTTYLHIKQNLFISLFYNCIFIPLAISGHIIPLFAAILMSTSSITVVLNSLRIFKKF